MKRYIIIASLIFLSLSATAQTEQTVQAAQAEQKKDSIKKLNKYKFGVKGGINFSNLNYNGNDLDLSSKTGFTIGVMGEIPIAKQLALQPEILYSQQGAESEYFSEQINNISYEGTIKLNYLNIPLMLKYFVADGLSLQAGPQIGFLLNSKNVYKDNFFGYENSDELDLSDYTHTLDFGVNLGVGYQFQDKIYVDARYNMSLSDVFEDGKSQNFINADMYNRVFQITVGYFFK